MVPEWISSAVTKCLQKDPADRYRSMEEFSTVLEMMMPLERPDRKAVVQQLVNNAREQERTRLQTSAGQDDRTSPMAPPLAASGKTSSQPGLPVISSQTTDVPDVGIDSLMARNPEESPYSLESDPPADLPPLEAKGMPAESAHEKGETRGMEPAPLTLKGVPDLEEDTGKYVEETTRTVSKRSWLWVLPVVLILAGLAYWLVLGEKGQVGPGGKTLSPVMSAYISVTADPAGRVFMDGELMGNARPTLYFDVQPGLHRVTVRHPEFGSRKYIVEVEAGEEKELEVKFQK